MKISTPLVALLFLLLSSCKQSYVDTDKAYEFYETLTNQIAVNSPVQQEFIDKLNHAILKVKEKNDAIIDTKELTQLLEDSKSKNSENLRIVEGLVEFDEDLEFKGKTMEYLQAFSAAYQNEIPRVIHIFANAGENKYERAKDVLFPKLKVIKTKDRQMKKVQAAFKMKYEELANSQSTRRTGSDYEYVKVKDFQVDTTQMEDGAKIKLLSYSGGGSPDGNLIYYKQFIGIQETTGDTLRILAFAGLQNYDLENPARIGTFRKHSLFENKVTGGENEYIIFNKNQTRIEKGNYKTVFGILEFDGQ